MSAQGLFTQLGMIVISIAIIITYIQPAFADIAVMQDDIVIYENELKEASEVSTKLSGFVLKLEGVTSDDRRRLLTYLPNTVDEIAVQRDLSLIAKEAGVLYISSPYTGTVDNIASEDLPSQSTFDLSVEGTYGQIKNLLRLMETNHYLLEIVNLDITRTEGGFLSADFSLVVYSYQSLSNNN